MRGGMKRIGVFSIKFVEDLIGEDVRSWDGHKSRDQKSMEHNVVVNGFNVYTRSFRYKTFMEKGYTCACCGRKGAYYALEYSGENIKRAHFNLYSDDGTLMTKDHVYPKSKGGADDIENFVTMCEKCNARKGNKVRNETSTD